VGEGDEPCTPPQPIVKARIRELKQNKKSRLNVLTPHLLSFNLIFIFETNHPSEVGLIKNGFFD
jgi:hypothetical protein